MLIYSYISDCMSAGISQVWNCDARCYRQVPALHGRPVARKVLFCPPDESRRNKRIRFCVLDTEGAYLEVFQVVSDTFVEAAADGASTRGRGGRPAAVRSRERVRSAVRRGVLAALVELSYGGNLRVLDCDWLSSERLCLLVHDTPSQSNSSASHWRRRLPLPRMFSYASTTTRCSAPPANWCPLRSNCSPLPTGARTAQASRTSSRRICPSIRISS